MWPSDRIGKYGNLCGHKTLKKKEGGLKRQLSIKSLECLKNTRSAGIRSI